MVNENDPLVYSVAETQKLLGLSKNSIYEAVRRHELCALRIGRRVLIPKAALERLVGQAGGMAGNTTNAKPTEKGRDDEP